MLFSCSPWSHRGHKPTPEPPKEKGFPPARPEVFSGDLPARDGSPFPPRLPSSHGENPAGAQMGPDEAILMTKIIMRTKNGTKSICSHDNLKIVMRTRKTV